MLTHDLSELPSNKAITLRNVICPYCGTGLSKENESKEHVIGRKFVPKGTLQNQWNLIVKACIPCNRAKADLEDDISAITMQPDVMGRHFGGHPQLAEDASHKATKARSRHTGKAVGKSQPTMVIKREIMKGVSATFNFTGRRLSRPSGRFSLRATISKRSSSSSRSMQKRVTASNGLANTRQFSLSLKETGGMKSHGRLCLALAIGSRD
ncbi:MAG: hypothetical protein EOR97_05230 [Mesorhizobium sp.]|uniref:HNH endonuclease n=1 Tax=Mesorhizobium sp. TaxID=1871066 RepID=UPI000FE88FD1|nr:hypothetical protein [Mesorhizobium sp.]RWN34161.1 MAG: hypothetical protein EOR97_05230 [Mesorhizobium sp.]